MALTSNKSVLKWVDEMVALTKPDHVVWIDGSEQQLEALRAEACSTGEMIKLNEEKLPGCYLHRSAVNDVARVEGRTFICTRKEEDAGPTNNWMDPKEAYEKLGKLFDGAMKGRTMYVIPYCMAHVGSPFAKVGIELTDSIYVVLSMAIMTRIGQKVLDFLGDSDDFVKGLHSKRISARRTATSSTSRRITPSGASTPATAAMCCWAKVLRPAHRLLPGQIRGLDGRAYAHPGHRKSRG